MIPSEPTLASVAQQIVEGRATDNAHFWVVLLALGGITALVAWFLAPYLSERGKLLALAETLERRLDEIRQTTDAAERIKTDISHSDWTVKEYKTLRRNKLELLVADAYKLLRATEADCRSLLDPDGGAITSGEFAYDLQRVSVLFFEGVLAETKEIIACHSSFMNWLFDWKVRLRAVEKLVTQELTQLNGIRARLNGVVDDANVATQTLRYKAAQNELDKLRVEYATEYRPRYFALREKLVNFEGQAARLMTELIAPPSA